ncbi:hypothetical protein CEV32_1441 [Brucella rhizosphaerae]|uniref:Uncharacterized protein n=1 Tax=Brucella rhizosphaerae TaxID=571254 RepID=A0A256F8H0_9HYPH|nr:hypothetical protein CEV32_1441 [Brucella rhizosphaerae]
MTKEKPLWSSPQRLYSEYAERQLHKRGRLRGILAVHFIRGD